MKKIRSARAQPHRHSWYCAASTKYIKTLKTQNHSQLTIYWLYNFINIVVGVLRSHQKNNQIFEKVKVNWNTMCCGYYVCLCNHICASRSVKFNNVLVIRCFSHFPMLFLNAFALFIAYSIVFAVFSALRRAIRSHFTIKFRKLNKRNGTFTNFFFNT